MKPPDYTDPSSKTKQRGSILSTTYTSNDTKDTISSMLKQILEYLENLQSLHKPLNTTSSAPFEEKQKSLESSHFLSNELFSFDIDTMGFFNNYFPENNIEKVLKFSIGKKSMSNRISKHLGHRPLPKTRMKDENYSP